MLKQGLNQKLLQKLSPQQIQFIQLLQLNLTELENRLEEELAENPALETGSESENATEDDRTESDSDTTESDTEWDDDFDVNEYLTDDDGNDSYYNSFDPDSDRDEIPYAGAQTLFSQLEGQLNTTRLSEHETILARHIIGMIEDDGYIRRPLKNIAYDLMFLNNIQTTEEELETILRVVQQFDPPGIAARSLEECLELQLTRVSDHPSKDLALKIIRKYLKELGNKHYDKLLKSLKVDRDELKEAIELIQRLNPKPGESQVTVKPQYVTPDFLVSERGEHLAVTLNQRNAPELKLSSSYKNTLKGYQESKSASKHQKQQVQFIKQKLDSAKWFIEEIGRASCRERV